jgi:hypothetical protein
MTIYYGVSITLDFADQEWDGTIWKPGYVPDKEDVTLIASRR